MKSKKTTRKQLREELNQGVQSGELELPEALILLRKVLGKSQLEYAQMVGVSKKIISDFELGRGNPTISTLNKIFAPLGVEMGLVTKRR
ncbi:MAG: helix-turn-helix transcriptional regulator [Pseudobdellovibrionaceae bacterium]|nr:helix-turn-helix transcriptional regulator [Bdellovibrionales bacterium]USN48470.1 MAG: helix-turn-helix transcriptional regulator [Pseudobdellovibrionaceae bacterium]